MAYKIERYNANDKLDQFMHVLIDKYCPRAIPSIYGTAGICPCRSIVTCSTD
jgi:hypothetical protein